MSERVISVEGPTGAAAVLLLGPDLAAAGWTGRLPLAEQFLVHGVAQLVEESAADYARAALHAVRHVPGRVHVVAQAGATGAALDLALNHAARIGRLVLVEPIEPVAEVSFGGLAAPTLSVDVDPAAAPWLTGLDPVRARTIAATPGKLAVEQAGRLAAAMLEHLGSAATSDQGYASRRVALGDAHVDATIASMSDYTRPFQDFLTRYCWGEVWTRPGLSRRDRSLATLAGLVVLGAPHEIVVHVRAGLRHGLTLDEIRELLQHMALYAGLPRASGRCKPSTG